MNIDRLVVTRAISRKIGEDDNFAIGIANALELYWNNDWGEASEESKRMNDEALTTKDGIMGVYSIGDEKIWIITDAGHELTTVLFPDDY